MSVVTFYMLSVVVLALLLTWPASVLIWVASVRRLERKTGRTLPEKERNGQKQRARLIAILLCFGFSALFNLHLLDTTRFG